MFVLLKSLDSQVLDVLLQHPHLAAVRAQVEEAGCELLPDWADGAVVLAPLTENQALEADVALHAHHIVVAQQSKPTKQGLGFAYSKSHVNDSAAT